MLVTFINNFPNPVDRDILKKYFDGHDVIDQYKYVLYDKLRYEWVEELSEVVCGDLPLSITDRLLQAGKRVITIFKITGASYKLYEFSLNREFWGEEIHVNTSYFDYSGTALELPLP